jgi:hypothetical protein
MTLSLYGSGSIVTDSGSTLSFQPSAYERLRVDATTGLVTVAGERRQLPPSTLAASLPTPYTIANRVNVETAVVAPYTGVNGTASFGNPPSTGVHYIKKFFNMQSTNGGSFNQTLIELDGRGVNFHELWIKITWGTRIQGVSDAQCALNERAYGCNKFNGALINYNISQTWANVDGNSGTYMNIAVVNSPTTGMLLVQYQEASAVTGSSFTWGYIEIMSIETLGDGTGGGSVPVKFNC